MAEEPSPLNGIFDKDTAADIREALDLAADTPIDEEVFLRYLIQEEGLPEGTSSLDEAGKLIRRKHAKEVAPRLV